MDKSARQKVVKELLEDDLPGLVQAYRKLVLNSYVPGFHLWFLGKFSDPTAWLGARELFTRSAAVWSAVGFVMGLGDRHTEK